MFPVEREGVRDYELPGKRTVIRADAGDVPAVEVAEDKPADFFQRRRFHKHEQPVLSGQIGPLNGGTKFFLQLIELFAGNHVFFDPVRGRCGAPPSQRKQRLISP